MSFDFKLLEKQQFAIREPVPNKMLYAWIMAVNLTGMDEKLTDAVVTRLPLT